ncbi:hypothetical protein DQ04_02561000 [Trypanosoma grayi]|uniref:hypothetical protein n=1 Tax=Trypanosoma grayi TaxID=71804 RepID=UPI0004F4545D|nr:hypothetical protein DQ04_02561000 [Trypanosoma grayi]KEG11493.1 hypothetical protein DQ04_02561000 [Trypanosoma grayi]
MGEAPSSSGAVCHEMTASFSFHEVERRRDSAIHSAVVESLAKWSFFPYPACTPRQLQQVDLFLVACSMDATVPETTPQDSVATRMVGVVGVVWVPLAPGALVEGYLQVVLVQPRYRRHRIAHQLLGRALRLVEGGDSRRVIARWRLHTMGPSSSTSDYLRRITGTDTSSSSVAEKASSSSSSSSSSTIRTIKGVEIGKGLSASDGEEANHMQVEEAERLVAAVPRIYESLGFIIRRNVYAYYGKCAEALEMVKLVQGARKRR